MIPQPFQFVLFSLILNRRYFHFALYLCTLYSSNSVFSSYRMVILSAFGYTAILLKNFISDSRILCRCRRACFTPVRVQADLCAQYGFVCKRLSQYSTHSQILNILCYLNSCIKRSFRVISFCVRYILCRPLLYQHIPSLAKGYDILSLLRIPCLYIS